MTKTFKMAAAGLATVVLATNIWTGVASAHVVVKPSHATAAAFQTFSVGVPTEGDSPTVKVRLVIPGGLKHVTPSVKTGWKIDVVKEGSGEDASVKEVVWSGGQIPAGQRDDFGFSAQLPAEATTLQWKAYQTDASGKTVSWDQSPTGADKEGGNAGPYSETKVDDDAGTGKEPKQNDDDRHVEDTSNIATGLSVVALVLSVIALTQDRRPSKRSDDKKTKK